MDFPKVSLIEKIAYSILSIILVSYLVLVRSSFSRAARAQKELDDKHAVYETKRAELLETIGELESSKKNLEDWEDELKHEKETLVSAQEELAADRVTMSDNYEAFRKQQAEEVAALEAEHEIVLNEVTMQRELLMQQNANLTEKLADTEVRLAHALQVIQDQTADANRAQQEHEAHARKAQQEYETFAKKKHREQENFERAAAQQLERAQLDLEAYAQKAKVELEIQAEQAQQLHESFRIAQQEQEALLEQKIASLMGELVEKETLLANAGETQKKQQEMLDEQQTMLDKQTEQQQSLQEQIQVLDEMMREKEAISLSKDLELASARSGREQHEQQLQQQLQQLQLLQEKQILHHQELQQQVASLSDQLRESEVHLADAQKVQPPLSQTHMQMQEESVVIPIEEENEKEEEKEDSSQHQQQPTQQSAEALEVTLASCLSSEMSDERPDTKVGANKHASNLLLASSPLPSSTLPLAQNLANEKAELVDEEMMKKDDWGNGPLHLAAGENDKKKVELLLMRHTYTIEEVNAKNDMGETPLMRCMRATAGSDSQHGIAFRNDLLTIAAYLIGAGSDVSVQDNEGYTPLMVAAARGDSEIFIYLLGKEDRDACINLKNKMGQSALMLANSDAPEIKELLEGRGAK